MSSLAALRGLTRSTRSQQDGQDTSMAGISPPTMSNVTSTNKTNTDNKKPSTTATSQHPDLVPMRDWLEQRKAAREFAKAAWKQEVKDQKSLSTTNLTGTSTLESAVATASQPNTSTSTSPLLSIPNAASEWVANLNHLAQVHDFNVTYAFKEVSQMNWASEIRLSGPFIGAEQVKIRDEIEDDKPGTSQEATNNVQSMDTSTEDGEILPGLTPPSQTSESKGEEESIKSYPSKKAAKEAVACKALEYITNRLPSSRSTVAPPPFTPSIRTSATSTAVASIAAAPLAAPGNPSTENKKRKATEDLPTEEPILKATKPTPSLPTSQSSENSIGLLLEYCAKHKRLSADFKEFQVSIINGAPKFGAQVIITENTPFLATSDMPIPLPNYPWTIPEITGDYRKWTISTGTTPYPSKKVAKTAVASQVISVLRECNKIPTSGKGVLSPEEQVEHAEHKAAQYAKYSDPFTSGLKGALPKETSYGQQVAELCLQLNTGLPRYEVVNSKVGGQVSASVWDCFAYSTGLDLSSAFHGNDSNGGPGMRAGGEQSMQYGHQLDGAEREVGSSSSGGGLLASVIGVYGKKQAKEAVAKKILDILLVEKAKREAIARGMVAQ